MHLQSSLLAVICAFTALVSGAPTSEKGDGGCNPTKTWKTGKIAFEEGFVLPELVADIYLFPQPTGVPNATFQAQFLDMGPIRQQEMDENGIEYMIISHTAPLAQGVNDSAAAEALATRANDYIWNNIKNNTARFGGMTHLSLHDPAQAAQELERTVTQYGFKGAFIYTYQSYGVAGSWWLEDPRFDILWQKVVDLDVPVYVHPRAPGTRQILDYVDTPDLIGGGYQFSSDTGLTVMKMLAYGVFDRFPALKVIMGHMGEHLPSDLFRLDAQVDRLRVALGMPAQHDLSYYFRKNLYETTSGQFSDALLDFHINQIGVDRITFSIDYPYERMVNGTAWLDNLKLSDDVKTQIARGNAINLFKLDL